MRLSSSRVTALTHRPQQDFPLWEKSGTRPSLDLQFADRRDLVDATTGSNLVDFTRQSSGTYVGSDGLIKTATTDEARFDHDPETGESLGLLVEESRTNLLLDSGDLSTANWVPADGAARPGVTVSAPDGTNSAIQLNVVSTGTSRLYQSLSLASGVTYTFSVWMRTASGTLAMKIGNVDVGVYKSVTVTTDWKRYEVTQVASSATRLPAIASDSAAGSVYLWGAQLEAGSFPTSYIPTTTAAVTRAADVATDTSTGADIRTLYAQFRSPAFGTRPVASLDDNTANERIELFTSGTDPKLLVTDGGGSVADLDAGAITANVTAKLAGRFATDSYAAAVNGAVPQTHTSGTLPAVDRLRIGSNQAGDYFNGTIARLTGWNTPLPDETLQTITG
jgi:hypothetical protein